MFESASASASFPSWLLIVAILFVVGAVLIKLLTLFPETGKLADELWPVYRFELMIVGIFLISLQVPEIVLALLLSLFVYRASFEIDSLLKLGLKKFTYVILAFCPMVFWLNVNLAIGLAGVVVTSIFVVTWKKHRPLLWQAVFLYSIIIFFVFSYFDVLQSSEGVWLLIGLYLILETHDAFAYVVGKAFGRHQMAPRISPKKTWEGTLGGGGIALIAGYAFLFFLLSIDHIKALYISLAVLVFGVVGDLLFSLIKRSVNEKDFPSIHYSSGGLLDIYDALIFSTPLLALALYIGLV